MRVRTIYRLGLAAILARLLFNLMQRATGQSLSLPKRDQPSAAPSVFDESERDSLARLFHINLAYLLVVLAVSLLLSIRLVGAPSPAGALVIAIVTGILGSAAAALISCLDRRANGFEDSQGNQSPPRAERVGRFNWGMFYWFLARPWLGAVTGAVAYWGIVGGTLTPGAGAAPAPEQAAFYGFLAGLLAKSLLDVLKGLLTNIFRQ